MTFKEMSGVVSMREQMQSEVGSVILINVFTVDPAQADELIRAWGADAAFFKSQPGFISAQLHRGIAGSGVFLNYAIWESVARFRDAFGRPEFQVKLSSYPSSTVASPHLFQKVNVPDICVA
jgi:heme-degrading monooxygenase HmoA